MRFVIPDPPKVPTNATPELRRLWLTQFKVKMALANAETLNGDNSPRGIRARLWRLFCPHADEHRRVFRMPESGNAFVCGNCGRIRDHTNAPPQRTPRPPPGPPFRMPPPSYERDRALSKAELDVMAGKGCAMFPPQSGPLTDEHGTVAGEPRA